MRRVGAVPVGSGTWLFPAQEPFVSSLERVQELVDRAAGSIAVVDVGPKGKRAEDVLRAAYAAARIDEWREFADDCGKFEAEIDKEFVKQKFTLGELEEEEQSLDRLRRWFAALEQRDVLELPEGREAAARLARCEQRLAEYAEQVYERTETAGRATGGAPEALQ